MPNPTQNMQYLDPVTNQYYTEQTIRPTQSYNNMGMGLANYLGVRNNNNNYMMPRTVRNYTGDVSVVNRMMQNRQPYQYNVPSIAQMFPSMAMPNMDFSQYTGGAGQFLGGLLGSNPMMMQPSTVMPTAMPTPVSTKAVK
jgi:hypothetical protein